MTETKPELIKDFIAAQNELPDISKTAKANYGSYATLDVVIKAVRPVLNKHNFALMQFTRKSHGEQTLLTRLLHVSGESIDNSMQLFLRTNDAQSQGSAITYARRYSLLAVLGLAPEDEDDDGQAASNRNQTKRRDTKPAPEAAPKLELPTDEQVKKISQLLDELKAPTEARTAVSAKMKTSTQAAAIIGELQKKLAEKQSEPEADEQPSPAPEATEPVPKTLITDDLKAEIEADLDSLGMTKWGRSGFIKANTGKASLENLDDAGWMKLETKVNDTLNGDFTVPANWMPKRPTPDAKELAAGEQ